MELWVLAEERQYDRGHWEAPELCYSVLGVYLTSEDANREISRLLVTNTAQDSVGTLRITVEPRTFLLSRTTFSGDLDALSGAIRVVQLNPGPIEFIPYEVPF